MIRPVTQKDAMSICRIYNPYIRDTIITFEEQAISEEEMKRRINKVTKHWPWLVCEFEGEIAGYAYATHWKVRAAYRYSLESTIYMNPRYHQRGFGHRLYSELISAIRSLDVHCVIGGIALPNQASVALHENLGFKKIAQFEEVGRKFGRWIDVGYWQLHL